MIVPPCRLRASPVRRNLQDVANERSLPDNWRTTWWIGFSPDREQQYMYVADGGDEQVKILDRASGEVLSSFGRGKLSMSVLYRPAARHAQ